QIARIQSYKQPIIEGESAAQRILDLLSNYEVPLFSVHRLESWREMYKDTSLLADRSFAGELLPCCLSVIQGKIKELDCLYLVRQDHSQRYYLPDKDKWIRNPDWPAIYKVFRELLAGVIAEKDGISITRAQEVIEQAFDSYMVNLLGKKWRNHCGKGDSGIEQRLRRIAGMVPGLLPAWRALHSPKPEIHYEHQLAELLNPSSSYHADFMPIYRVVTRTETASGRL
ncbi:MAG: hypothetical protein AABZ06_02900, partial [Bdellovibrionota bacterium]